MSDTKVLVGFGDAEDEENVKKLARLMGCTEEEVSPRAVQLALELLEHYLTNGEIFLVNKEGRVERLVLRW